MNAPFLTSLLLLCLATAIQAERLPEVTWKFTTAKPADGWQTPDFDDSTWKSAPGGFGKAGTPGAQIRSPWSTSDIWIRRKAHLAKVPPKPVLFLYHDEDTEIFINGKLIVRVEGFTPNYRVVRLDDKARAALVDGENQIAAHCHQTVGGQAIDIHLIPAAEVQKYRALAEGTPEDPTEPFATNLITEWGSKVTAEYAWQEYPRPQLVRENWKNLNGHWDYAITTKDATRPSDWDGKILVPFAVESKLSGVSRLLQPDAALWYRRSFEIKRNPARRILLNFEAVDYRCRVWVNNTEVGRHVGGNTPFSFDITDALIAGENNLVVRVEDATGGSQLRGKQTIRPKGIFYTRVSGIWQTVWLEDVPATHIRRLKITPKTDGFVTLEIESSGSPGENKLLVANASLNGKTVSTSELKGPLDPREKVVLEIPEPKLWSPDSPTLYDISVTLGDDTITSYVGIREVGRVQDDDGHWHFTLNGKPIFHWGPLDQGWWPDGLLTPPSDAAMRSDVDFLKAAGFNMIRKHIKVEPRRYYAHCDQIGMMVWQDHVSGGPKPPWTRLKPAPKDADWSDADHAQFMAELDSMITSLESHPSIVVWVPFNEAWGQHRTVEVGKWTAERDPTRHVNIASGGNFWPVGDIVDAHQYPDPGFPFDPGRFKNFIKVIGEFGGHGWPVEGHLWDHNRGNWGYGGLPKTIGEFKGRYVRTARMLGDFRKRGIAAGVYTQTTDVEVEINGLITYDRKVQKISPEELKKIHREAGLID